MKIIIIINIKDYKCEFMSEKIKRERETHYMGFSGFLAQL
jgi:hypothetical protein